MNRFLNQSVIFLTSLMMTVFASADTGVANVKAVPAPKIAGATPDILSVVLALFAVIAVILLLAYLAKRINPTLLQKNSHLKIIASQSLGPRERMVLVAVGEQQLLLGVTSQQVTLLHTLSEPLALQAATQSPFAVQLQDILTRRG